jgi:hypothetical protein
MEARYTLPDIIQACRNQAHRQMSASLGVEICCKRRRFTRMPIALLAPLKWILLD